VEEVKEEEEKMSSEDKESNLQDIQEESKSESSL